MKRWSVGWAIVGLLVAGTVRAQEKPATGARPPAARTPAAAPKRTAPGARPPKPEPPRLNPRLPKETQAAQLALYAEDLQATGYFADAAQVLQQAAELTPGDWLMWDKAGWAHLDNDKPDAALKAFEAAQKAAPAGTVAPGGLMVAHFGLGHEKEVLDRARQLIPADAVERAAAVIHAGLAAKPASPEWNYALGYLYTRVLGNSRRALGPLEAVVQSNPKHADTWLLLVENNRELDRGPQEDAAAVKYLELAPETVDAFRLRAERLASLQRFPEAVAEYEAGVAKHPLAVDLYYQMARVQERMGQPKQAEATYRNLIAAAQGAKQDALTAAARTQLANFHARHRNYVEAEKFYREASLKPDATPATWTALGSVLALSGKWDEAAKSLETAAAREEKERGKSAGTDDLVVARYHAAVCRLAAGQRPQARDGLAAALALKSETRTGPAMEVAAFVAWLDGKDAKSGKLEYRPSDERWGAFTWRKAMLAEGEFEVRGRYSPAATAWRAVLQQVQKRYPDSWPADYALARIYAAGGATESAVSLLRNVTRRRADWWAPYYALGQLYTQNRNKDDGTTVLRRVLLLAPDCRQAKVYLSYLRNLKDEEEESN